MRKEELPSHYFVVKSPFAQLLLTGVKAEEYRSMPRQFANKRLAVAVARSRCTDDDFEAEASAWREWWDKPQEGETRKAHKELMDDIDEDIAAARELFHETNGCGLIIGEIETEDEFSFPGCSGVGVKSWKLWERSEWIPSPGGLGVRKMPSVSKK